MSNIEKNKRRLDRMGTWISHAETVSGEENAHIRFLFYWIAYEAAYQVYPVVEKSWEERERLHRNLAFRDMGRFQRILRVEKDCVRNILELRYAYRPFWNERTDWNTDVETAEEWEIKFGKQVESASARLNAAIHSDDRETLGKKQAIARTLDDVFGNLNVVRNQIVHGASAGPGSRGRTQVILGAGLLGAFIPCFRDGIEHNMHEDWGAPPFPRVGKKPDEKCAPPWLATNTGQP